MLCRYVMFEDGNLVKEVLEPSIVAYDADI